MKRMTAAIREPQGMIGVGLIDPSWLTKLPPELAVQLTHIMDTRDA